MHSGQQYLNTKRWKDLRTKLKAERSPVCHICRGAIDLSLSGRHRMGWSLDHVRPIATGGDPFDETNLAPAHLACNSAKAARGDATYQLLPTLESTAPATVFTRRW